MSIYKMIQKEREDFFDSSWTRNIWGFIEDVFGSSWNFDSSQLPEIHRFKDLLSKEELSNARDRAEIVTYWLENERDYSRRKHTPIKSLDDARLAVQNIDDGRIGWYDGPEHHPAWHTEIGK